MIRRRRGPDERYAPAASLWWLQPGPLIVVVIVPMYLSFMAFDYTNVVPKAYVPGANYAWGLVLLLALALGAAVGAGAERSRPAWATPPTQFYVPLWMTGALLVATLFAYGVWFGALVVNYQVVLEVFTGQRDHVRDVVQTIPGVTTLTQCGAAYVVLVALRQFANEGRSLATGWERAGVVLVILLALVRAFLWAERLALLEVLVAYGVAVAAFYRFRTRGGRKLAAALPLVGPVILYLVFTGTEYFRSWGFYQNYYDSIWQFSFERLMTYYAVAANNGIGLLEETMNWPHYTGRYVFEWAYEMPGLGELLRGVLGDESLAYQNFLLNHARPEFNNPSGLFPIVFDVGYFGSALYFLLVGGVVGIARRAYVRRQPFGLLFFPFGLLFVLEVLRFNYLAAGRFFPIAASLAFALFVLHQMTVRPGAGSRQPLRTGRTGRIEPTAHGLPSNG